MRNHLAPEPTVTVRLKPDTTYVPRDGLKAVPYRIPIPKPEARTRSRFYCADAPASCSFRITRSWIQCGSHHSVAFTN